MNAVCSADLVTQPQWHTCFVICTLLLTTLKGVGAWVRHAPAESINFRIPPELLPHLPPIVNYTQYCYNWTEPNGLQLQHCEPVTHIYEVDAQYQQQYRKKPGYYISDALVDYIHEPRSETLTDWNVSASRMVSIGCFAGGDLDSTPGAIRANVTGCRNTTVASLVNVSVGSTWNWTLRNTSWIMLCDGGLRADNDMTPYAGITWTPLNCSKACTMSNRSMFAVNGIDCWCLWIRSSLSAVSQSECSHACAYEFYNGTRSFCGGPNYRYSLYQEYDHLHQTPQSTLDPFRKIWYWAVTVEKNITFDTDYGKWTTGFDWFLFGVFTETGDPAFPFHRPLDGPHYGLHYDLDNSSIVGYTVPYWPQKGRPAPPAPPPADGSPAPPSTNWWYPVLNRYEMDSGTWDNIYWYPKDTIATLASEVAVFSNGISCLDSVYNIYYLVVPNVQYPYNNYNLYNTKIVGYALDKGGAVILAQGINHEVVLLEVDSRDHTLYGLLLDPGSVVPPVDEAFLFFRLGHGAMTVVWPTNPLMSIQTYFNFHWTYTNNRSKDVFNHDLFMNTTGNITEKYFQMGTGSLDAEENVTFVVYKHIPDTSQPYLFKDVSLRGNHPNATPQDNTSKAMMPGPTSTTWGVTATWISNPDPIRPWYRPRLEYLRFSLDGDELYVKFQNFTEGGIQPYDINGDTLPDRVDWSKNQLGLRNCSDMFGPNVTKYFGDMPNTTCEWYYNDTIHIYLTEVETLYLYDPVDLKNDTIFGYLAELRSWTFSTYGIYPTQLPDPLYPPVVDVFSMLNGVANVDLIFSPVDEFPLCATGGADAMNSYWHGGTPYYTWIFKRVDCQYFDSYGFSGTFMPNFTLLQRFATELGNKSVYFPHSPLNWTYKGRGFKSVHFPIHGVMEPGCSYQMSLHLLGRWFLATTVSWSLSKRGPPGVQGWVPPCDYHCNPATCEPPSECLMVVPGPLTGPTLPGERACVCDEDRFGIFCAGICPLCSPYRTFGCDDGRVGTGKCICQQGWAGDYCDQKLEFWATSWSQCTPCGAAIGQQTRQYKCTNIVTLLTTNASRCIGSPPVSVQNCLPPLCPCGPPPEISGALNASIAQNCPVVKSGASCAAVCQKNFVAVGTFVCYGGQYVEMARCEAAGNAVTTYHAVTLALRLNSVQTTLSANAYLSAIAPALKATLQDFVAPTVIPAQNINLVIQSVPASVGGRRLATHFADTRSVLDNTSRSRQRSDANSSNGHHLFGSDQFHITDYSTHEASLDQASSIIAGRILGVQRGIDLASASPRQLQTSSTANSTNGTVQYFEIIATFIVADVTQQATVNSALVPLQSNPTLLASAFNAKYAKMCPPTCILTPWSWGAGVPQNTLVYSSGGTVLINTTMSTTPAALAAVRIPSPEDDNWRLGTFGIIALITIILCILLCIFAISLGLWLWHRSSSPVEELGAPELPPGMPRHWEMPESAKICDANGAPQTGIVKWKWQGGGDYEGEVYEGMRQGNGRMQWPNGKNYSGQWLYGRPHGHGLLHAPGDKGWTYNGQFKEGQRHGIGRCESFARKIWYDGEWNSGLQNGMGENGTLPNLPADLGSRILPPPVAHIWWMEQGEQNEHISISKVAPESRDLIGLALEASVDDWERLAGNDYSVGGKYGPPPSQLQELSRLWGICYGNPDGWLPTAWGALLVTRIMEGSALARWNMWQVRDFGDNANTIHPNALIWRVNGVEGDVAQMARELQAEQGRHRLQLAASNPPHIRFPKTTGLPWNRRPTAAGSQSTEIVPAVPAAGPGFISRMQPPSRGPIGPPPRSPFRKGRLPSPARGRSPPPAIADLRSTANAPPGMPGLAQLQLPGLPAGPPHRPPSLPRPVGVNAGMPALPALPDAPRSRDASQLPALPPPLHQPPMPPVHLPSIQPHLSTLPLPPAPGNVPKPPPGRRTGPLGPPPKGTPSVQPPPPRIGYRAIAAATRQAEIRNLQAPGSKR